MNKRLKIAVVVRSFPTITETFIVNQIISLIDLGHDVTIFSYRQGDPSLVHEDILQYDLLNKCQFYKEPSPKIWRRSLRLLQILFSSREFRFKTFWKSLFIKGAFLEFTFYSQWIWTNKKFDVIHCHFANNAMIPAKLKLNDIITNEKLILSFHGADLLPSEKDNNAHNYSEIFKTFDYFTVNTVYLEGNLHLIYSGSNVHILPVGLDTKFFSRKTPPSFNKTVRLLFCGRLISLKNPAGAVQILKVLINSFNLNCHLNIVGDGPERKILQSMIENDGMKEYVSLVGSKSKAELKEIYENSDFLLMPGIIDKESLRAEAQGLVIQEAQSMGVIPLVSDVGGMKYGLEPYKTGFIIESEAYDLFAEVIHNLVQEQDKFLRMKENAIHFAQEYDNKTLVKKLIKVYENAL